MSTNQVGTGSTPSPISPQVSGAPRASGVGSHLFVPSTNSEHRPLSGNLEPDRKTSEIHAGKYFSTRLGGRLLGMIQDLTFVGEALLLHTDCDDATLRELARIDQTLRALKDRIHPASPDTTAAQRARPLSAISNPPSAISPQI